VDTSVVIPNLAKEKEARVIASSSFNFERDLQHDRHPEWKVGNAENHPDRKLVFSKDIAQQLRGSVSPVARSST
jgi:hypothetical protein